MPQDSPSRLHQRHQIRRPAGLGACDAAKWLVLPSMPLIARVYHHQGPRRMQGSILLRRYYRTSFYPNISTPQDTRDIGGTRPKVENRGECQMDRFEIYLSTLVLPLQMSAWMKAFFGLKRSKKKIDGELTLTPCRNLWSRTTVFPSCIHRPLDVRCALTEKGQRSKSVGSAERPLLPLRSYDRFREV